MLCFLVKHTSDTVTFSKVFCYTKHTNSYRIYNTMTKQELIDSLGQFAAGLELDNLFCRNLNGFSCLRVSSLTSITL